MAHTIEVKAQQDFWKRFVGSHPSRAMAEIISNSFDADADEITLSVKRNPLGEPVSLFFSDNGEGIHYSDDVHPFSDLGNSWKSRAGRSQTKKRILQGRNGEGRFRALSLGEYVEWRTVFESGGNFFEYSITANNNSIGRFYISDLKPSRKRKSGTTVEITNLFPSAASYFSSLSVDGVAHKFASYINKYRDVSLKINDCPLDIAKLIVRSNQMDVGPITLSSGLTIKADLEVIEWSHDTERCLYLCDESGFTLAERAPEIRAPGYNFSAYLKSKHFSDASNGALIDLEMEEGISKLVGEGRDMLTAYFKRLERLKVEGLIAQWKSENVYPYREDETSEVIKQSKRIFNVCAVTINSQAKGFSDQNRITKALSFRLLREAIEERPSEVSRILTEVLNLSHEKAKQFARLLDNTKLSDIIDTVSLVRHRISIARGLRSLVCSEETKKTVKERQHIHQIVERNSWLFGDEFTLGVSESSLKNALKEHLKRLKINENVLLPVLVAGKANARLDLMLCQASRVTGRNDDHHLVIELKRAKKILGMEDYTQILNYAEAIMKDSRYKKTNVRWSFWLVGVEMSSQLESIVSAQDRPPGCAHIFKEGNGRIWVKTWGQLLHECISRLEFVRERLDLAITDEESVSYLNEIYPQFVPNAD
ncbi:ATP-binding protein [Rhizobium sp. ARZ01]|uniref:ATP-binding protein n=1 Tax=Rhizobium sp. ARZ01 TaxID=2769313 RepID=UPI0017850564|nr:ATP-binding protein [Rhizobium sp. ARZ01]MBD9372184.1 ATP-binding protein [Rhizobium sp. ARZ01]